MRNKGVVFVGIFLPLMGVFGVACLTASARFTYTHPQGTVFQVQRDGRVILPRGADTEPSAALPKAVAEQTTHDFGTMDPLRTGRHRFVIRNEGAGPLSLVPGATSCKCTLGTIHDGQLAPGDTTEVTLEWKTGRDRLYSHYAIVRTNDPRMPEIELRVEGQVRVQLGTTTDGVLFGEVVPGEPATAKLSLYSQMWDAFEIVDGECSTANIDWTTTPLGESALAKLKARAGHEVTVTTAPDMEQGPITGVLRLTVKAANALSGEEVTEQIELPLGGRVMNRLAVYGSGVDSTGTVDLGHVHRGEGLKKKLLVKVRDDVTDLKVTRTTTTPEFIKVGLTPADPSTGSSRMAYLRIEIPTDAPVCHYRGRELGTISLEFDHPRIKDLELKAKFAILK